MCRSFGATMSDSNVENLLRNVFLSAAYIVTSGAMILYNAKILKEVHPYPALLTTGHMVFSGGLSVALVKLGPEYLPSFLPADFVALPPNLTRDVYVRAVMPIAGLQGLSLWLSNMAYLFISVSLIQMIKASNTVWTYLWTVPLGLTTFSTSKTVNLAVIGGGVAMACNGAVSGSVAGMTIGLAGIMIEAGRLALVQLLLQKRGLKLSPITTLYYLAPTTVPVLLACAVLKGEVTALAAAGWTFPMWMMLSNMMLAFSLNFVGLLVIRRMSAIAYVLSGIVKDIGLVSMGALLWGEVVTAQQIFGWVCEARAGGRDARSHTSLRARALDAGTRSRSSDSGTTTTWARSRRPRRPSRRRPRTTRRRP